MTENYQNNRRKLQKKIIEEIIEESYRRKINVLAL